MRPPKKKSWALALILAYPVCGEALEGRTVFCQESVVVRVQWLPRIVMRKAGLGCGFCQLDTRFRLGGRHPRGCCSRKNVRCFQPVAQVIFIHVIVVVASAIDVIIHVHCNAINEGRREGTVYGGLMGREREKSGELRKTREIRGGKVLETLTVCFLELWSLEASS